MPNARGSLEFADARRSPVELSGDIMIGRAAGCRMRLYDKEVSEQHARITFDAGGAAFIEDLQSQAGTRKNGEFVYGKQPLVEGDQLQLGPTVLIFHLKAVAAPAPAPKPAAPPSQPARAAASDRTIVPGSAELPPEVRAFIAAREAAEKAQKAKPAANVTVGKAEPEPTNNRTVQMDSTEIERMLLTRPAAEGVPGPDDKNRTREMDSGAVQRLLDAELAAAAPAPARKQSTMALDAAEVERQLVAETVLPGASVESSPLPPPPGFQAPVSSKPVDTMEMQAVITPSPGYVSGSAQTAEFDTMPPPVAAAAPLAAKRTLMGHGALSPTGLPRSQPHVTPTDLVASPAGRKQPASPDHTPTNIVEPLPAPAPSKLAQGSQASFSTAAAAAQSLGTMKTMPPMASPQVVAPVAPVVPVAPVAQPDARRFAHPLPGTIPIAESSSAPPPQRTAPPPSQNNAPVPIAASTTAPVEPLPAPQAAAAYTAPHKGSFGSFSRALSFMGQMFSLARQNAALLKPLLFDLAITTPLSVGIAAMMFVVHSRGQAYAVLGLGTALLYFTDYACNSLTASLMFDFVTTGRAEMGPATARVKKALPGIMLFAGVSALLDVASTYARERDDVLSRILLNVLRAIWTTATYVIMPALVIEGVPFGVALKRSKELMGQDPTGVGAGVVAMSITSYIAALVIFPTAWFAMKYGTIYIHPFVGTLLFFLFVNLYWSVSGWMKISYATCFYLWARECERHGVADRSLAPLPLRTALDAG